MEIIDKLKERIRSIWQPRTKVARRLKYKIFYGGTTSNKKEKAPRDIYNSRREPRRYESEPVYQCKVVAGETKRGNFGIFMKKVAKKMLKDKHPGIRIKEMHCDWREGKFTFKTNKGEIERSVYDVMNWLDKQKAHNCKVVKKEGETRVECEPGIYSFPWLDWNKKDYKDFYPYLIK